jgi:hypothetical protein
MPRGHNKPAPRSQQSCARGIGRGESRPRCAREGASTRRGAPRSVKLRAVWRPFPVTSQRAPWIVRLGSTMRMRCGSDFRGERARCTAAE